MVTNEWIAEKRKALAKKYYEGKATEQIKREIDPEYNKSYQQKQRIKQLSQSKEGRYQLREESFKKGQEVSRQQKDIKYHAQPLYKRIGLSLPTQQQGKAIQRSGNRLLASILPIPGAAVYGSGGAQSRARNTRVKPAGSGRGRPKGAFDARYAKYGGVMNYRRLMARQAAYQRLVQAQQYAQQRPMTFRERIIASRQIPQQQQQMQQQMQQQAPQQMPQQYTQEGQQMPQEMAQMQPQQQYPQQQQMPDMQTVGMDRPGPAQHNVREIRPVFKSSGGRLGYEVNQRPLVNNPQGDYYEDVDMLTGRRFLKRRPQAEGWLR